MGRIVDNGIIILFGVVLACYGEVSVSTVYAMLFAIISASFLFYIKNIHIKWVGAMVYIMGCFFNKEMIYFMPVFFYAFAMDVSIWCLFFINGGLLIYQIQRGEPIQDVLVCMVACIFAALYGYRCERNVYLQEEIISLRDSSTERQIKLRERNEYLLEKQEYEIHLATLAERNRIAREIHDNVGHMLSRSILQMGALLTIYKESPLQEQLESVNKTLNQAMNSIRESVHDLHDNAIDLRQAIAEATREIESKYELFVEYDIESEVSNPIKYSFIMIIKEAMANIVKHSNGNKVEIILREHPGLFQLMIEDDGDCTNLIMSEGELPMGGIGLKNMKDRVDGLDGIFRVRSDNGFKIFVSVPKEKRGK